MNAEKLKKLSASVRTGGKGSVRRKKLVRRAGPGAGDKNLIQALKKVQMNQLAADEVKLFNSSTGKVLVFNKPILSANIQANTVVVQGRHTERAMQQDEVMEGIDAGALQKIISQLQMQKGAADAAGDDVPALVGDFEQAAEINADAEAAKAE